MEETAAEFLNQEWHAWPDETAFIDCWLVGPKDCPVIYVYARRSTGETMVLARRVAAVMNACRGIPDGELDPGALVRAAHEIKSAADAWHTLALEALTYLNGELARKTEMVKRAGGKKENESPADGLP